MSLKTQFSNYKKSNFDVLVFFGLTIRWPENIRKSEKHVDFGIHGLKFLRIPNIEGKYGFIVLRIF